jgi:hypothetical protein
MRNPHARLLPANAPLRLINALPEQVFLHHGLNIAAQK